MTRSSSARPTAAGVGCAGTQDFEWIAGFPAGRRCWTPPQRGMKVVVGTTVRASVRRSGRDRMPQRWRRMPRSRWRSWPSSTRRIRHSPAGTSPMSPRRCDVQIWQDGIGAAPYAKLFQWDRPGYSTEQYYQALSAQLGPVACGPTSNCSTMAARCSWTPATACPVPAGVGAAHQPAVVECALGWQARCLAQPATCPKWSAPARPRRGAADDEHLSRPVWPGCVVHRRSAADHLPLQRGAGGQLSRQQRT